MKEKLVLGIETSCDETGVALLRCNNETKSVEILSEKLHSQVNLHKNYGGVVPELAAREHTKSLPLLTSLVLKESGVSINEIDRIGVTTGPGLKGCLLTGMLFASGLSFTHNIELFGVNHIEGHVLSVLLDNPELTFPFIALVVSGGHTELHYVKGVGEYSLIARTSDDAAGEAFDKSANLLGIDYPGGPELAALGDAFSGQSRFTLPTVMQKAPGFSFSGLKTAISLLIKREEESLKNDPEIKKEIAWTIQDSILNALLLKTKRAIKQTECKHLAISGGVSANSALRERLKELKEIECFFPLREHCVDNGAMIAYTAFLKEEPGDFITQPRWRIERDTLASV